MSTISFLCVYALVHGVCVCVCGVLKKPPRKDVVKIFGNQEKVLRFRAKFENLKDDEDVVKLHVFVFPSFGTPTHLALHKRTL